MSRIVATLTHSRVSVNDTGDAIAIFFHVLTNLYHGRFSSEFEIPCIGVSLRGAYSNICYFRQYESTVC